MQLGSTIRFAKQHARPAPRSWVDGDIPASGRSLCRDTFSGETDMSNEYDTIDYNQAVSRRSQIVTRSTSKDANLLGQKHRMLV